MTAAPPMSLFDWQAARDTAMKQASDNAGPNFKSEALKFVVKFLRENGEQSGEAISAACVKAGIEPHDLRAFGSVFMTLIKDRLIEKCGECKRLRGHGTSGGSVYRVTK